MRFIVKPIKLVQFAEFYFPVDAEDFNQLRDLGVTVFRFSDTTLSLLKRSVLKQAEIELIPWTTLYSDLVGQFRSALPEGSDVSTKREVLVVAYDKHHESNVAKTVDLLKQYLSRYCCGFERADKEVGSIRYIRLTMDFVPTIQNAAYFGHVPKTFDKALLRPSADCHLSFARTTWTSGQPAFAFSILDRMPGSPDLHPSIERSFLLSSLSAEDCYELARFFAELGDKVQ